MANSRNQQCSCGSGKKYKKCCMEKSTVIDLQKRKEENFYEQKHILTTMVTEFVWSQLSDRDHEQLEHVFEARIGNVISEEAKVMMYHFFILFIHRFDNGLRGVEWFDKELAKRLPFHLQRMAKEWTCLRFQLVHAIEITDEAIIFQDVITNETYPAAITPRNVPREVNLYDGTLALLEFHQNKYYFNGVKVFNPSSYIAQAKRKVEELMNETGLPYQEVMMEYTLEILKSLLADDEGAEFTAEDIQILEQLGFNHLTPYAEEFLAFYKEKTSGKKGNTVRKYRESLHDFHQLLERNEWFVLEEIDAEQWIQILSKEYFDMYSSMTKTQVSDLFGTLKAFIQWKKKHKKETLWPGLTAFLKEEEAQFVGAVAFSNMYIPYRYSYLSEAFKEFIGEQKASSPKLEGVFEIIKLKKESFRVVDLTTQTERNGKKTKGKEYTISSAYLPKGCIEQGLIFKGEIQKGNINMWELVVIDKAYPRSAKEFIHEEIELREFLYQD